jgi:ectoine hydroxylase-related dioxygenase (phytanoyl-CoA dioxygenase family)
MNTTNPQGWDAEQFRQSIFEHGFCLVDNVLTPTEITSLKQYAQFAIDKEAAYHGNKTYGLYGGVQACPMYGGPFLTILDNRKLMEPMDAVMGEGNIIWTYITTSLPPKSNNFSTRIHVDRPRLFPGYCESIGALILLDDFTEANGGTWYLPGSHNRDDPTETEFYANALRLQAPAGSVFYFNLRLWHAGGYNATQQWRHALIIAVMGPYIKQKFDFPRMLPLHGINTNELSDYVKQKLGFGAIPPVSLDEFWREDKKTYRERSEWEIAKREKRK